MRISDLSSAVCSSVLPRARQARRRTRLSDRAAQSPRVRAAARPPSQGSTRRSRTAQRRLLRHRRVQEGQRPPRARGGRPRDQGDRSEEHTSELQSLMRISYAVFCLQKKKTTTTLNSNLYKQHQLLNNHTENN